MMKRGILILFFAGLITSPLALAGGRYNYQSGCDKAVPIAKYSIEESYPRLVNVTELGIFGPQTMGNQIIFGSDSGQLFKINDPTDKQGLNDTKILGGGDVVATPVVRPDNTMIETTTDGKIWKLGKVLEKTLLFDTNAPPAATGTGTGTAANASTASPAPMHTIHSSPALMPPDGKTAVVSTDDGFVYMIDKDNNVLTFSPPDTLTTVKKAGLCFSNCTEQKTQKSQIRFTSSPTPISSDMIAVGTGDSPDGTSKSGVDIVKKVPDGSSGKFKLVLFAHIDVPGPINSTPVLVGTNRIAVGGRDGEYFLKLDTSNVDYNTNQGAQLVQTAVVHSDAPINSTAVVWHSPDNQDARVFWTGDDGHLYMSDTEGSIRPGSPMKTSMPFDNTTKFASPTLISDPRGKDGDKICAGADNNYVCCWNGDGDLVATSRKLDGPVYSALAQIKSGDIVVPSRSMYFLKLAPSKKPDGTIDFMEKFVHFDDSSACDDNSGSSSGPNPGASVDSSSSSGK